jgi:hypothetical protein
MGLWAASSRRTKPAQYDGPSVVRSSQLFTRLLRLCEVTAQASSEPSVCISSEHLQLGLH